MKSLVSFILFMFVTVNACADVWQQNGTSLQELQQLNRKGSKADNRQVKALFKEVDLYLSVVGL